MRAVETNSPLRRDMIGDELQKLYRIFLFDTEEHYDELIAITTRAIQAEPHNGIALNPVASAFPVACCGVSERMGNIIIPF